MSPRLGPGAPVIETREGILHVEYAERRTYYGILFIFTLLYEYINLKDVHIHVIYRVNQAEYIIRILVAAPPEHVNIYSTRREGMGNTFRDYGRGTRYELCEGRVGQALARLVSKARTGRDSAARLQFG